MLILAIIVEHDESLIDALDEFRFDEFIGTISRVAEKPSFFTKAGSQIGIKVTRLFFSGRRISNNQHVVVVILNVPVINQGHQNLQALQFLSADKRILFPVPTLRQTLFTFDASFESRIFKSSLAVDIDVRDQVSNVGKKSSGPD